MAMILVSTNLPAEKFSGTDDKAKEITASVSKHFDIKPEHVTLGFHPGAKYWYNGNADPVMNVEVVVPAHMLVEDKIELAIELMTKAVQENYPEVTADRVVIFFRAHDPKLAGVKGKLMSKAIAENA